MTTGNSSEMVSSGRMRYQNFTSSGTFTPSAALLAAGGVVRIVLVGGGGGKNNVNWNGGHGGCLITYTTLSTATAVTIGAGGADGYGGSAGGSTTFNSLSAAGGSGAMADTAALGIDGAGWDGAHTAILPVSTYGAPGQAGFAQIIWSE